MAKNIVEMPYEYFPNFNKDGPIYNGKIFIGEINTDPEIIANQKDVTYQDACNCVVETPIIQPIRTGSGGVPIYNNSPVRLFVDGAYSIKVLDKYNNQIYYTPNVTNGVPVTQEEFKSAIRSMTLEEARDETDANIGMQVRISDVDNNIFIYKTGLIPNGDNILDGPSGFQLLRSDHKVISKNNNDYASFSSNLAGPISIIGHSPGSIESDTSSLGTLKLDSTYRITVNITTTSPGFVKILFDGTDAIYGDQPNGQYFSNAAILADGSENNRTLSETLYTFTLLTFSTPFSTLKIETDLLWGGTISSVTVEEVTPVETNIAVVATDGEAKNNSVGLKTTKNNRGDVALGDRGTMALAYDDLASPTPAFSTAVGSRVLMNSQLGDHNSSFGAFSLQSNEGSNNDAFGYSALKLCVKGQENSSFGYKSGTVLTTGYKCCFFGFFSGVGIRTGSENSEFGWRPIIQGSDKSFHTSFGSRAGTAVQGDSCTFVGASSGISVSGQSDLNISLATGVGAECKPWGDGAVTLGYQSKAGSEASFAAGAVALGQGANAKFARSISAGFNSSTNSVGSISIGDTSLAGSDAAIAIGDGATADASRSISIGQGSSANGVQSAVIGALATPAGSNNSSVGFRAGNNFNGTANTFLGHTAGLQAAETFSNCTLLGSLTVVTGSNQVQLGDSSTTTYAFGAVQDRSDKRDKIDIKDLTDDHINFFMDVEWKQYRMNYRESYVDIDDDTGDVINVENDGSRSGTRFHVGAIAQQVEEAMIRHNIDFAGLQHHSVKGGKDVYSIGYQEFIAIQGLIIQRQQKSIENILSRLSEAGI